MKKSILSASILSALAFNALAAAPIAPTLQDQYTNYTNRGFVTVSGETGAYNKLVKRVDVVELPVKWAPAHSGDKATSWQLLVNGEVVTSGTGPGGNAIAPITSGGLKEIVVRVCNDDGCTDSATDKMVVSDTDGSHLEPLGAQVNSANTNYAQSQDQIVGTYFVEWGIYGRKFFVENIPANNLTHIIYGFVPMCGENRSLKDGNPGGWGVLQSDCSASQDYELVIHDMGAAFWRQNGAEKAMKLDGKAVGYGEVGVGNFGHLMALKQGNPHLKIIPSIGGWTLSDPFYGFTNKANRDTFVASSKEFLKTWKFFDGIDIDWEFPGGGGANTSLGDPVNDGPAYIALMQELRAMLDELSAETGRKYELTSAIGVGWDKLQDVDYAAAAQYMDNIFMMSYDFYGAWGSETGHQTALYCGAHVEADKCAGTGEFGPSSQMDKTAADYAPAGRPEYTVSNATRLLLEQGVPAKKLVVGAAMYGRGWTDVQMVDGSPIGAVGNHVSNSENNPLVAEGGEGTAVDQAAWAWEAGIMDYRGALKYLEANQNAKYVWDEQAQASFIWDDVKNTLITLDTPQSIVAKGMFLKEQGLGGIFSWEIDGDGGNTQQRTLNAMNQAVGNAPGITDWSTPTPDPELQYPIYKADAGSDISTSSSMSSGARTAQLDGYMSLYKTSADGHFMPVPSATKAQWTAITPDAPSIYNADQLVAEIHFNPFVNPAHCDLTKPKVILPSRQYEYQLTIGGTTDTMIVTQNPINVIPVCPPTPTPEPQNTIVADAGEDIDIYGGGVVLLDGSQSIIKPENTNITYQWTEMLPGGDGIIKNAVNTDTAVATLNLPQLSIYHNCKADFEAPSPTQHFYQLTLSDNGVTVSTDTMQLTQHYKVMPSACPTPPPPPTLIPTPPSDDYIPGETKVSNGDKVSYAGSCFVAKNSPGTWEAPKVGSWFWDEVDCGVTTVTPTPSITPTPPVTPTPPITITPTPPVGGTDWNAESIYNSGDTATVNGVTYVAGWWTKGQEPGTTGEWGVWKIVK